MGGPRDHMHMGMQTPHHSALGRLGSHIYLLYNYIRRLGGGFACVLCASRYETDQWGWDQRPILNTTFMVEVHLETCEALQADIVAVVVILPCGVTYTHGMRKDEK